MCNMVLNTTRVYKSYYMSLLQICFSFFFWAGVFTRLDLTVSTRSVHRTVRNDGYYYYSIAWENEKPGFSAVPDPARQHPARPVLALACTAPPNVFMFLYLRVQ